MYLHQENQENVSNLVIDDTELKQVAYIYKCVNTTLQIKGKINSITVGESPCCPRARATFCVFGQS